MRRHPFLHSKYSAIVFCLQNWLDTLLRADSLKALFLKRILSHAVKVLRYDQKLPGFYTCDPLAVALSLDHRVALEVVPRFCTVELHGTYTRGQMVVDWKGALGRPPNVHLVGRIDDDIVRTMLEKMI